VLVVEILKLFVSLFGMWSHDKKFTELRTSTWSQFFKYSIPGILYAINNNIFLIVLLQLSPALFQLLLNLRVVWTAFIFKFMLGRQVSGKQWIAISCLIIGCVLSQSSTVHSVQQISSSTTKSLTATSIADSTETDMNASALGLILVAAYTLISTSAGVINEVLLKSGVSLHTANFQLYFFGVILNFFALMQQGLNRHNAVGSGSQSHNVNDSTHLHHDKQSFMSVHMWQEYFRGWDEPITITIAVLMAISGLLISRIMQKFDSIIKIYCVAVSNLSVYLYLVFIDGQSITISFLVAFILVSGSAYYYQIEKLRIDAESAASVVLSSYITPSINNFLVNNSNDAVVKSDTQDHDIPLRTLSTSASASSLPSTTSSLISTMLSTALPADASSSSTPIALSVADQKRL
jgi:hypothetical protein